MLGSRSQRALAAGHTARGPPRALLQHGAQSLLFRACPAEPMAGLPPALQELPWGGPGSESGNNGASMHRNPGGYRAFSDAIFWVSRCFGITHPRARTRLLAEMREDSGKGHLAARSHRTLSGAGVGGRLHPTTHPGFIQSFPDINQKEN